MTSHIFQSDPGWLVELSLVTVISLPPNEPDNDHDEMKKMTVRKKKSQELSQNQTKLCRLLAQSRNSCRQMSAYRGKADSGADIAECLLLTQSGHEGGSLV